jgi:hypothetical protein
MSELKRWESQTARITAIDDFHRCANFVPVPASGQTVLPVSETD